MEIEELSIRIQIDGEYEVERDLEESGYSDNEIQDMFQQCRDLDQEWLD